MVGVLFSFNCALQLVEDNCIQHLLFQIFEGIGRCGIDSGGNIYQIGGLGEERK